MIITPEPGMHKEIAQVLLHLADDPNQVQTATTPSVSFVVPVELFKRFEQLRDRLEEAPDEVYGIPDSTDDAEAEVEKPKRRGRPRRQAAEGETE